MAPPPGVLLHLMNSLTATLPYQFLNPPHCHSERSRPTFSSRTAPAMRSACAERNLSSPYCRPLDRVRLLFTSSPNYRISRNVFSWDARKALSNLKNHGVPFE